MRQRSFETNAQIQTVGMIKQALKNFPKTIPLSLMTAGLGLLIMLISLTHIEMGNKMDLSTSVYIIITISIMLVVNFGYFSSSVNFLIQIFVNSKRIG